MTENHMWREEVFCSGTRPLTCCDAVCSGAHGGQAGVEQLSFSHKNTLLS